MQDERDLSDGDPVYLDDLELAAANLRNAEGEESKVLHRAYLERLVIRCHRGGDVLLVEVARAAKLRYGDVSRLIDEDDVRLEREAAAHVPKPKLRIVSDPE